MGFFDKLINSIKKAVGENSNNSSCSSTTKAAANVKKGVTNIPEEYNMFPVFDGHCVSISTRNENKYKRCTMDYQKVEDQSFNNFLSEITSFGFEKATNVRYDYGNKYIIVERNNNDLHLVFHIKK